MHNVIYYCGCRLHSEATLPSSCPQHGAGKHYEYTEGDTKIVVYFLKGQTTPFLSFVGSVEECLARFASYTR